MATRREYSLDRLDRLGAQLESVRSILADRPICVYATGSYGRLEAWHGSDADLFFLYEGEDAAEPFPWIEFTRLAARVIDVTEEMRFPRFSGDGRYLEALNVGQMEEDLGSPDDDSTNAFTARMLLLLESRPIYDKPLYESLLERVVSFYYRDFDDYADRFVPGFLINDILRFWRTLTLNYEHHRRQLQDLVGEELHEKKASSALKNYKLKVSRMATCYSMIASLGSEPRPVTADTVLGLCRMTPADRLLRLADRDAKASEIVKRLEDEYERFLRDVQRPEAELLDEFASEDVRTEKLARGGRYGKLVYELLTAVVPEDRMRYLVV